MRWKDKITWANHPQRIRTVMESLPWITISSPKKVTKDHPTLAILHILPTKLLLIKHWCCYYYWWWLLIVPPLLILQCHPVKTKHYMSIKVHYNRFSKYNWSQFAQFFFVKLQQNWNFVDRLRVSLNNLCAKAGIQQFSWVELSDEIWRDSRWSIFCWNAKTILFLELRRTCLNTTSFCLELEQLKFADIAFAKISVEQKLSTEFHNNHGALQRTKIWKVTKTSSRNGCALDRSYFSAFWYLHWPFEIWKNASNCDMEKTSRKCIPCWMSMVSLIHYTVFCHVFSLKLTDRQASRLL